MRSVRKSERRTDAQKLLIINKFFALDCGPKGRVLRGQMQQFCKRWDIPRQSVLRLVRAAIESGQVTPPASYRGVRSFSRPACR